MFVVQQLGESANTLVARHKGYRYGFPDFYAAEFPFAPMNYDKSRIYQGAIGRHYPDAQTRRYHYLYDPNMYQQPGVPTGAGLGDATTDAADATKRKVGGLVLGLLGVGGAIAAACCYTRRRGR